MAYKLAKLVMLTLALSACQQKTDMADSKHVIIPEAFTETYEQFQYAPAVRAGDMLYVSGIPVHVKEGEEITSAITRAFDEIELVLTKAGADWSNVIDVTSYMTDMDSHLGPLWEVKGARIAEPYPAWSAIGVDHLYGGEATIIEIKLTAYLPN